VGLLEINQTKHSLHLR